jgi:hypothetical protein
MRRPSAPKIPAPEGGAGSPVGVRQGVALPGLSAIQEARFVGETLVCPVLSPRASAFRPLASATFARRSFGAPNQNPRPGAVRQPFGQRLSVSVLFRRTDVQKKRLSPLHRSG